MSNPIRMCIGCRGRFKQIDLIRLQFKEAKVVEYTGLGRSFYICKECIKRHSKSLLKKLSYQIDSKDVKFEDLRKNLKEIVADA